MATVSLQATYDQARRLLESGDAERAVALTQHIIQHFPRNLEAQRLLGEAYLASRQLEQAQTSFQTALASDPENIPAYVGLGITHEREGDLDQAIQSFEHALEIKPDMPELRSQLLRLYTETWGSEGAQLRLSRAGLARLYAKGHMLAQAVQEFRSVINDQPDRLDARVALAEVLWRDGQEDAAITTSEEILQDYPYALKPNLLLGYLHMASGDPQGEGYWNRALELDPYQTVARTMFDQLPLAAATQPTLPEWDEQAWKESQQPPAQAASQSDQQTFEPVAATTGAAVAGADEDFFGGSWMETIDQEPQTQSAEGLPGDDDFLARLLAFDGLRPDALAEADAASVTDANPFSVNDLAPLSEPFSFDAESATAAQSTPEVEQDQFAPLSLADLGLSEEEIAQLQQDNPSLQNDPQSTLESESSDTTLTPFSLAELGLSEDEIAQVQQDDAQPDASDPLLTPFSLDELGLSEDEIAQLQDTTDSEQTQPAGQMGAVTGDEATSSGSLSLDDEMPMTPFSLSDLGLSEDEIAQINQQDLSVETGDDLGDVKPFSMDDWGLDETSDQPGGAQSEDDNFELPNELQPFSLDDLDIGGSGGQHNLDLGMLPPSLQPFSLDDIGDTSPTSDQTGGALGSNLSDDDDTDGTETGGYSFRQARGRENTTFGRDPQETDDGARPSIFSKLKQRHSELPYEEPVPLAPVADDDMDMSLFGNDDVPLRDDSAVLEQIDDVAHDANDAISVPDPLAASDEPDLTPFSFSDLGLSPEEIAALGLDETSAPADASDAVSVPEPLAASDEPDLTPFSFSDLGLSPEEIAALGLDETSASPDVSPDTSDAISVSEPLPASDEPDLTPFSFSDLGLSPEEIAALGLDEASTPQLDETPVVDNSSAETPSIQSAAASDDEPDLTPFSLADLGLSAEEIAALGLEDAGAPQNEVPHDASADPYATLSLDSSDLQGSSAIDDEADQSDVVFDFEMLGEQPTALTPKGQEEGFDDDIRPFSLDDLGLGGDESGIFDGSFNNELGLTEEELAGMDLGALEQSNMGSSQAHADEEQYPIDTGDPVLDQLIMIGRRQGFVDLDDIIQAVENPEEESERIEEIGLVLHRAGIQIRDGDEIIDMDEEGEEEYVMYAEEESEENIAAPNVSTEEPEETVAAPISSTEEPELTPFSLADLGLSPEEIAALGLEEAAPQETAEQLEADVPDAQPISTAPSADAEPDMTPFSLADLGLSPEEIAALGLDEETPGAVADESAPVEETEPELTSFSFDDLGLSSEEIASLNLEETINDDTSLPVAAESPVSTSDEPDLTPFSLADLGLSPDEIAALGLEETTAAENVPSTGSGGDEFDAFDFSMADDARSEVVPATSQPRVREQEPPPPELPKDAAFEPKALEELDSIWDAVPAQPTSEYIPSAPEPPVQPQRAETKRDLPPASERIVRFERPQPEAAPREPERREPERRAPEPRTPAPVASSQPAVSKQPSADQKQSARPQRTGSWQMRQSATAFIPTGDAALDGYLLQLEAEPDNTPLRVAVARISGQTNRLDLAVQQYKALIKAGDALDQVTEDLEELVNDTDDRGALQKLYRLLGDAYTKQNRFRDAVEAYSWTFAK